MAYQIPTSSKGIYTRLSSMFLAAILIAACSPTRGCIESDFTLAPESRVPQWFASAGVPLEGSTVTMAYWIGPVGRTATFTLLDKRGNEVASVVGQMQGNEPLSLTPHGETERIPYPSYEIITVHGVTEIVEHRAMEPVFYLSDDPEIMQKLKAGQGTSIKSQPMAR